MQTTEKRKTITGRRAASAAFVPIALLTAFLCSRSYVVEGIKFIEIDFLTIIGICLSLGFALIVINWWVEDGDGWADRFRLLAGCAPFAVLLWYLDPLGSGPMPL